MAEAIQLQNTQTFMNKGQLGVKLTLSQNSVPSIPTRFKYSSCSFYVPYPRPIECLSNVHE